MARVPFTRARPGFVAHRLPLAPGPGAPQGPLATNFPVENRLTGQTADDLKRVLQSGKGKPYVMRIADFHLLLFLSGGMFELHDVALLCEAVKNLSPVPEGFQMLIDAIAGARGGDEERGRFARDCEAGGEGGIWRMRLSPSADVRLDAVCVWVCRAGIHS